MSDYAKLVEDLKRGFGHWYVEDWSRLVSMYADAAAAIEDLQAQLPKRGEWITIRLNNGGSYTGCSCCEAPIPTDTMLDYIPESESKYCYSCEAKMEVRE